MIKKTISSIFIILLVSCASVVQQNNWIEKNTYSMNNKKLTDITIPGTHYSNAYNITANSPICNGETTDKIQPDISSLNIQNNSIKKQLNKGIRYLELKICIQDAVFYTSNYFLTERFSVIVATIKQFISQHPKEIIVIDFADIVSSYGLVTNNEINILHTYLQETLGSYLMPNKDWNVRTISDILETKHRIVLISSNKMLIKFYDVIDKSQFVTYIQPQTRTQDKIDIIKNTSNNPQKFTIMPIYSKSQFESTDTDSRIVLDYLYHANKKLNIVVGDKEIDALTSFAIYSNTR